MKVTQIDLKSNMDRFIGGSVLSDFCVKCYLKSNMDRFIGISADEKVLEEFI